jgi:hypothetical protein
MDRKTFAIGVLTVTAVLLFIAQFMPVRPAFAGDSVGDRDYQLTAARSVKGGEALYVFQRRSGMAAVFSWDASDRRVKLRAVRSINDAILQ